MSEVHAWLLKVAIVWSQVLVVGFVAVVLRGRTRLERVLAVSGMETCLVVVLALLAFDRREVAYLDAALALSLLAFLGTIAAARFRGRGGLF